MEESNSQPRWALALLLIFVPAGLFARFRLSGILQSSSEPSLTKTVGKAIVVLTMNRSKDYESYSDMEYIFVNETIESSYIDNDTTINFTLWVIKYFESDPDFPTWWNDYLKLAIDAAADTNDGFILLRPNFLLNDFYKFFWLFKNINNRYAQLLCSRSCGTCKCNN